MKFVCNFSYKKRTTLFNNLTIDFPENKITVLCGHNGAGKTTLLKCMSGIFVSKNIVEDSWYVGSNGSLIVHLSLLDNLSMLEYNKEKAEYYFSLFDLSDYIKRPVYKLSTGQAILCSIVVALLSNRNVLFLDEVLGPLDPVNTEKVISELKNSGKTIFITSHDLSDIVEMADKIIIMKKGQIAYENDNSNLSINSLKEIYKGVAC